jgi:hypothetical protein
MGHNRPQDDRRHTCPNERGGRITSVARADLDKARDTLWDTGNLVEAIRRIAENMEDRGGDLDFVIQTVARIAKEKINEVAGGVVLSPPPTKKGNSQGDGTFGAAGRRQ